MTDPMPRIYADTSVFGGVFDEEFASPSRAFFEQVWRQRFRLVCSALVRNELTKAPEPVRKFYDELSLAAERITLTDEARELQNAYLREGIVSPRYADDALHVAAATVHQCNLIISWNFRHIVHFDKIEMYNRVNARCGYGKIEIHSPWEVIAYED
jgi:predicted nucleic acid-binding protein